MLSWAFQDYFRRCSTWLGLSMATVRTLIVRNALSTRWIANRPFCVRVLFPAIRRFRGHSSAGFWSVPFILSPPFPLFSSIFAFKSSRTAGFHCQSGGFAAQYRRSHWIPAARSSKTSTTTRSTRWRWLSSSRGMTDSSREHFSCSTLSSRRRVGSDSCRLRLSYFQFFPCLCFPIFTFLLIRALQTARKNSTNSEEKWVSRNLRRSESGKFLGMIPRRSLSFSWQSPSFWPKCPSESYSQSERSTRKTRDWCKSESHNFNQSAVSLFRIASVDVIIVFACLLTINSTCHFFFCLILSKQYRTTFCRLLGLERFGWAPKVLKIRKIGEKTSAFGHHSNKISSVH